LEQAETETSKAIISSRAAKMRVGKHNMAKGAMRPEEAAVRIAWLLHCDMLIIDVLQAFRLRATLDREKRITTPRWNTEV
jgi:general transcription factor 3C polypeptide 5 (transcription factor C subunit 1)